MHKDTRSEITKEISCRVTRTLLMYVRENNNGKLDNLLDGLPLDEGYLSDANNWVSHAILQVLYQRMIDMLGDKNAVYHMTLASERLQSLGLLDRIVRLLGSPKLIYSQAPKYNKFLKLNGSVFIHETGDSWVILEDRYHDSAQKTRFDCDYTRGILVGIPTMFGLPPAKVEEIKCQVAHEKYGHRVWPDSPPQGCEGCFYRVSWVPKKISFLKRFSLERNTHHQAIEDLVQANKLIQSKYDDVKRLATDLEKANQQLIESKQALESQKSELIESERKYRNLFEKGSDLLCIHDLNGNLIETNLPFKKEYGWRQEDLEGLNICDLIPEQHMPKFEAYMARITSSGSDNGYLKAFTRSGREVILEYRNKLILGRNGQPEAVQAAARDVTQRIAYEEALKESEEKYKEIVKYAPAGIFEFDMEKFKLTSVNEVMCEYTGYTKDELLQLDPFDLLIEESRERAKKRLKEVFSSQENPAPSEYKIHGKNGSELSVIMNSKFFFEDGIPKKAMTVVHDLTAIRKAEEEKKILEVKLQNAKKLESLGTLAGGVAHDLNNILSGIVSYPELLLLDIEEDSPLREPLLKIKKSGEKAAELVQDLLTLARRSVVTKNVINLNSIVNNFINSPEYIKIVGDRHNIDVETNISEGILEVVGSATHLSKTVMNLVANAADAMPTGGRITISTRDCYIDRPYTGFEIIPEGEYVILEISDIGIGMPQSDLEKIFEPFYTKKVMGSSGTGLGMSVVWGTVKDHDGFINITTEEGSGTTFVLFFPASRSEKNAPTSIYIEDYLGRGESILIIDDVPEQRELAKRMMQRLGYDVYAAASGEKAVALIKKRPYDVLILDMIMPPGMNGLETYREILSIVPDQKAVIASGYAETEHVHEAQRMGAGSYIKKPYTLEKMGVAIRSELDRE
ncbi:MAG: PAS domain S-box protein [Desulfosarcina sp.]|nr:PAS domain S-box protein [Desulfosarcina sp.]MBC2743655.1 PAS domain S-box protein [Desulfosarcina sp.]MBC2766564.1 PAS domain S-box protein [Desulfosarcina sp.]